MRRAISAASSVGRARASSIELVWSDWQPPRAAARAWMATRTILFSGCWAVSEEPAVCAWKRRRSERESFAPKRSRMILAQRRRAARYLAISSRRSLWALKKKESCGANSSIGEAGVESGLDVGDAVGEREGDFLDGGRAGFADVIAGDGDGIPLGEIVAAPGENVGDDAHGGTDGINVGAASDVFLENVVLHGAGKFCEIGALFFGDGDVEAEEDGGGGVDGHGGGDFFERDIIEESFHVFERIDGYADFADFAESERVVGVHADLRG